MCSAAPAAGGPHLLPEQEAQVALQQEGQEGSVSTERWGSSDGVKGEMVAGIVNVMNCIHVVLFSSCGQLKATCNYSSFYRMMSMTFIFFAAGIHVNNVY